MRAMGLVLATALAAGCGAARVVYQAGNTGTIELSGDRAAAMAQASDELATVCGANNATIVAQGFETAGSPSWIAPGTAPASVASSDATQDGMIWRIHFRCGA